jgi:uncharacterized protein
LTFRIPRVLAVAIALLGVANLSQAQDLTYRQSVEKWRQDYETGLKAENGWLSVAGLFWLHDGENRFGSGPLNDIVLSDPSVPETAGYFDFHAGKTVVHIAPGVTASLHGKPAESAELQPDSREDRLSIGSLVLYVHASGDRYAIRMKDNNSRLRKEFTGLHWYPVDESYRVTAKYVPYNPPKQVGIQNGAGDSESVPFAGYTSFTLHGIEYRLDAEADKDGALSFVFRDLTSGKETYAAARFLDTAAPKDGTVILDFNEAYNPPCAYNPYTTCPLPPFQNRLRVEIPAGEKAYRH